MRRLRAADWVLLTQIQGRASCRANRCGAGTLSGRDWTVRFKGSELRGADRGSIDLDRLGALSGAIISHAQAERILVELANVVVMD